MPGTAAICTVALTTAPVSVGTTVLLNSSPPDVNIPPTVTIPPGSSSNTFYVTAGSVNTATSVTLTASYMGENETFEVTVYPPPAALSGFSISPATIISGQSGTGTVSLTATASAATVISLSNSNPAAAAIPATVTVSQGANSTSFPILVNTVNTATAVTFTASYSGASMTAGLLVNPPPPVLSGISISPSTIVSGHSGTGTVTLNAAAGAGGAVVSLSSSNAAVVNLPSTVTIPQNATSASFMVVAGNVAVATPVTLTGSYSGVNESFSVIVNPLPAVLSGMFVSPSTIISGQSGTGMVSLTAPAGVGGAVISLWSSNAVAASLPATVTVPQGSTSVTFPVVTSSVYISTPVTLSASYSGASETFVVSVNPQPTTLSGISLSTGTIASGQSATGTVNLTVAASSGGIVVSLSSSNSAAANVPATVTIPQGMTSATFTLVAGNVNTATAVTLTASFAGVSKAVTLNVNPVRSRSAILSVSEAHYGNFTQGQQNANYEVTVSNAASAGPTNGMVLVTDMIPSGMTLISMSGTGWSCTGNTCTRNDVLSGGGSYPPVVVTVDIAFDATSPELNQVSVSGGGSVTANASNWTVIRLAGKTAPARR